jgi:hypothetical protein
MRFRLPVPRFTLVAALVCYAGFLSGCAKHGSRTASFGSSDDLLSYGVYSAQSQDASGMATKLSLNQNNTYSRKKFQGACLLAENKGEWKADHDAIEFRLQEVRKRNDCNSEDWRVEKVDRSISRMLRNVTTKSFDLLDQEEDVSAQWVRFIKR